MGHAHEACCRNTVPVCLPNTDAAVSVAVCDWAGHFDESRAPTAFSLGGRGCFERLLLHPARHRLIVESYPSGLRLHGLANPSVVPRSSSNNPASSTGTGSTGTCYHDSVRFEPARTFREDVMTNGSSSPI